MILVTHSLETARQANSLAVLDTGQLIDHGTHDELMQRCQRYRQLTGEA